MGGSLVKHLKIVKIKNLQIYMLNIPFSHSFLKQPFDAERSEVNRVNRAWRGRGESGINLKSRFSSGREGSSG